jgi:hypothetical protein
MSGRVAPGRDRPGAIVRSRGIDLVKAEPCDGRSAHNPGHAIEDGVVSMWCSLAKHKVAAILYAATDFDLFLLDPSPAWPLTAGTHPQGRPP